MSTPKYESGTYTSAVACSQPLFSAPLPGVNVNYMLKQDFMINQANYSPLALDTAHATYTDYKLAQEDAPQDLSGGKVRWTRTYLKLPDEYSEMRGNYNYSFIGFYGVFGINVTAVTGRPRKSFNVPLKVTRTFFNTATPLSSITINQAQRYIYASTNNDTDYLGDHPPLDEATSPTRTAYEALIAAGTYIVAENSTVQRWLGNFWIRETYYVKAQ